MLLLWYGICGGGDFRALQQNIAAILRATDSQLPSELSSIIWSCSMPTPQDASVCITFLIVHSGP